MRERVCILYCLVENPFVRGSRALGLCAQATLEEYIWHDINITILQPATMQKVGTSLAGTIVSSIVLGHARHSIRLSDATTKDIDTLPAIRVRQCGYHSISAQSQDEAASPPQNLYIIAEDAPNRLTSGGSEWRTRREASKRVGAAQCHRVGPGRCVTGVFWVHYRGVASPRSAQWGGFLVFRSRPGQSSSVQVVVAHTPDPARRCRAVHCDHTTPWPLSCTSLQCQPHRCYRTCLGLRLHVPFLRVDRCRPGTAGWRVSNALAPPWTEVRASQPLCAFLLIGLM